MINNKQDIQKNTEPSHGTVHTKFNVNFLFWQKYSTSNVTSHHRGPNGLVTERHHYNARQLSQFYASLSYVVKVIFLIAECSIARILHAIRTFKVQASSSSSIAELAHGEKSRTQSLTHSLTHSLSYRA